MTLKKNVKAFLGGMAFPSVFLPFAYTVLFFIDGKALRSHPLQFIPMYIPLLFGLTNVLYYHLREGSKKHLTDASLWLTGGCLGFVVAVFGVFAFHIPTLLFGLSRELELLPLVLLPIIYGAIFRFIIKRLNKILAV